MNLRNLLKKRLTQPEVEVGQKWMRKNDVGNPFAGWYISITHVKNGWVQSRVFEPWPLFDTQTEVLGYTYFPTMYNSMSETDLRNSYTPVLAKEDEA